MENKIIEIGQKIYNNNRYNTGYGIVYEIIGEQNPESIGDMSGVILYGGSAQFKIVFDTHFSTVSEAILHSCYEIENGIATEQEINKALISAKKAISEEEAKAKKKADAMEKLRIKIKKDNPHLKTNEDFPGKPNRVIGAKNIRIELKKEFPGQKFSVNSESFSMGDAIRINWTDGPLTKDVDEIVDKYQYGHFNGMEDIYEHDNNAWTDVFGSTKYVSTSREYSEESKQKSNDEFKNSDLESWEVDREKWRWMAEQDFYKKADKPVKKSTPVKQKTETKEQNLPVEKKATEPEQTERIKVVHNEKLNGIEIYFSCKPDFETRDILKDHGFRWHRKKACWYVKKSNKTAKVAKNIAGIAIKKKPEKETKLPENVIPLKPVEPEIVSSIPEDIKHLN